MGIFKNDFAVTIAGVAGDGSFASGDLLALAFKKIGWYIFTYRDFPSNIRGEPTSYTIRFSKYPIMARRDVIDVLVSFNAYGVTRHKPLLSNDAIIIYDNSSQKLPEDARKYVVYEAPFARLAKEKLGREIYKNVIALGVLVALTGINADVVKEVIRLRFGRKGEETVRQNYHALDIGIEFYRKMAVANADGAVAEETSSEKVAKEYLVMTGNDAAAIAALMAGCRLYAGYPITPSSEVLEHMAKHLPRFGGVFIQAESEVAAINMLAGAAFAGARAMTATSGAGYDLMTEGVSLLGMIEAGAVIYVAQRAGPSTGMATKPGQEDLKHAVFGSHGDFPKVVLTPGTVQDTFYMVFEAFNIADEYQLPVIVLTDQVLAQNRYTIPMFDLSGLEIRRGKIVSQEELENIEDFRRYVVTEDGVSPRSLPGMKGGLFLANSVEHDEYGHTSEDMLNRRMQMEKRMRKMSLVEKFLEKRFPPRFFGDEDANIGFITFGSNHGVILESMEQLRKRGVKTKYLQITYVHPFPKKYVNDFLKNVEKAYVVEMNYSSQLLWLIRMHTTFHEKLVPLVKYDGQAFRPIEVTEHVLRDLGMR